ncbi:TPA: YopX family protein [Listeria monocytogenes]
MREIEFRGKALISIEELDEIGIKHKNGYVYGDLADNSHIVTGILESNDEYICSETWCGIDSKTIGQYTGLKDKNGKKIFEGDIVDISVYDRLDWSSIKGKVVFLNGAWLVVDVGHFAITLQSETNEIEIIGNVHENLGLWEA